jgi:hypothetical protein
MLSGLLSIHQSMGNLSDRIRQLLYAIPHYTMPINVQQPWRIGLTASGEQLNREAIPLSFGKWVNKLAV